MEQAVVPSYVREQRMTQWVENYADDIKKVCFIYLADRTQAEDALQDTFLRIPLIIAPKPSTSSPLTKISRKSAIQAHCLHAK